MAQRQTPQGHLDRLSSIDAGFLHQEDGGAHMHIGGLAVFEGPAPSGEQFREHIASRLPLVPRYRQRVVEMPLGTGRPVWADDAGFRVGYHVRHTALPSPGSEQQLLTLVPGSSASGSTAPSRCGRRGWWRASRTTAGR